MIDVIIRTHCYFRWMGCV